FCISGPDVLKCSQFVDKELMKGNKDVTMSLDLLPNKSQNELLTTLTRYMSENPKKSIKNILKGVVPERFLTYMLDKINIKEDQKAANTSNDDLYILIQGCKRFNFKVDGSLTLEKAYVTGGGITTKEIVPKTIKSKLMTRLFLSG